MTSGTTARRPRADAARNRDALVAAGRQLLAERGGDAPMEEIARRAGVGVGTLYRHFPRRIDLVEAVYREDVDRLVAAADHLAATASPWDALAGWLAEFLRYAEAKRAFLTELRDALEKSPELGVATRERVWEAGRTVLRRAQEAGVARPDFDEHDLMQLVSGMCMAKGATLEQNQRLLAVVLDGVRAGVPT